jgi:hypothetical protein
MTYYQRISIDTDWNILAIHINDQNKGRDLVKYVLEHTERVLRVIDNNADILLLKKEGNLKGIRLTKSISRRICNRLPPNPNCYWTFAFPTITEAIEFKLRFG